MMDVVEFKSEQLTSEFAEYQAQYEQACEEVRDTAEVKYRCALEGSALNRRGHIEHAVGDRA